MRGELDYEASLRCRLAHFKGLDVSSTWSYVKSKITLRNGMAELVNICKKLNIETMIVSGGFIDVIHYIKDTLGMDHGYGNAVSYSMCYFRCLQ